MIEGEPVQPAYRIETDATSWIRAEYGGFLRFHVSPGSIVGSGERIATNTSLTGDEQNAIYAPRDGVVLGMTTLPAVAPGDPICHLAYPKKGQLRKAERRVSQLGGGALHERMRDALASSMEVVEKGETRGVGQAGRIPR